MTWSDPSGLAWDFWGGLASAAKNVASFVNTYKAEIVGGIVGLGVFVACTGGSLGAGVVLCGIAAGAAGSAVTSLMKSAETGKFSAGGFVRDVTVGTVFGGLTAGVGSVLGSVLRSVIPAAGAAVASAVSSSVKTVLSKTQNMVKTLGHQIANGFKSAVNGGKNATSLTGHGTAKSGTSVVIGRNMGERVIPYAKAKGLDYYNGTPGWVPRKTIARGSSEAIVQRFDLYFNKRWINGQMRRGSKIIDIGEPPGFPASSFYDMERQQVAGYWNYFQDIQP